MPGFYEFRINVCRVVITAGGLLLGVNHSRMKAWLGSSLSEPRHYEGLVRAGLYGCCHTLTLL